MVAMFGTTIVTGPLAVTGTAALASPLHGPSGTSFQPISVTFVSLRAGWALGSASCGQGQRCLALMETANAGVSWSSRPLPSSLVARADRRVNGYPPAISTTYGAQLSVRFANPEDGWIFGTLPSSRSSQDFALALWSTHNGGLTWRPQPVPPGLSGNGQILDLEASAGTTYLMGANKADGVSVDSSPVSGDKWAADMTVALMDPAGGSDQAGAIVLQGRTGWLVEGNDRGTTGSAQLASDGRWVSWAPPCATVGGTFSAPAASNASNLVALCVMGGYAGSLPKDAPKGATLGSSWLYFSDNGGKSFQPGPEVGTEGDLYDGVLASPSPGVILLGRYDNNPSPNNQELEASFDGGHHWTAVYQGAPYYVGFTSPNQGVGLLQTLKSSSMIMTFDGGHHWSMVKF